MKKSTQTALWIVGGAAVLYYFMKSKSTTPTTSTAGAGAGGGACPSCPSNSLAQNVQSAICDISQAFSSA